MYFHPSGLVMAWWTLKQLTSRWSTGCGYFNLFISVEQIHSFSLSPKSKSILPWSWNTSYLPLQLYRFSLVLGSSLPNRLNRFDRQRHCWTIREIDQKKWVYEFHWREKRYLRDPFVFAHSYSLTDKNQPREMTLHNRFDNRFQLPYLTYSELFRWQNRCPNYGLSTKRIFQANPTSATKLWTVRKLL